MASIYTQMIMVQNYGMEAMKEQGTTREAVPIFHIHTYGDFGNFN